MRYYYLEKTYLYVGFDYDPTILAELKRIGGFLYNPQNKEWYKEVSLDTGTVIEHFFKKYDFKYGRPQVKEQILDLPKYDEVISMEDLGRMIDGLNLKRKPRNYQLEGIHYMINHPNCVNGCDMGLGKTGQAIVLAETLELFPCLVVTPASVKYGWRAEWDKWVEQGRRKIQVLESKSDGCRDRMCTL